MIDTQADIDLQPRDIDAERALLGAILREPSSFRNVIDSIDAIDFADFRNQRIFLAMQALDESNVLIELVRVASHLRDEHHLEDVGGLEYLSRLDEGLGVIFGVEGYCRRVKDKSLARQAIALLTKQIHEITLYGDTSEVLAKCEQHIRNLSSQAVQERSLKNTKEIIDAAGGINSFMNQSEATVSTSLPELDLMLGGGFRKGEMIVIGARTSVGKTALGLQFCEHADRGSLEPYLPGVTPAMFSLEMDAQPLIVRMACAKAGVSSMRLRLGILDKDDEGKEERRRLMAALTSLSESNIHFDDTSYCTLDHIRRSLRQLLQTKPDLGLVVIDYLQLMNVPGRSENRNQEVSTISRGLKLMAKEFAIPFVVLSQLRRSKNPDDEPNVDELRESGSIGQDADVVMLLHKTQQQYGDVRITKLIVEKQRNGPIGAISLEFHRSTGTFYELNPAGARQIVD